MGKSGCRERRSDLAAIVVVSAVGGVEVTMRDVVGTESIHRKADFLCVLSPDFGDDVDLCERCRAW